MPSSGENSPQSKSPRENIFSKESPAAPVEKKSSKKNRSHTRDSASSD